MTYQLESSYQRPVFNDAKKMFLFLDGAVESFLLDDAKQNVFSRIELRRTPFRNSTGKDCGEGATPVGWYDWFSRVFRPANSVQPCDPVHRLLLPCSPALVSM